MSSYCWGCERGMAPDKHDCRKNHAGSAKSMESAAALKLLVNNENLEESGTRCEVLATDGDASAFANFEASIDYEAKKVDDVNHTVKTFNNALWKAKNDFRFLTKNVINYLKACLRAAIKQNKDNVPELQRDLKNIVAHTFGEHDNCKDWCKAKGNPDYVYKYLPNGGKFTDPAWRAEFDRIIAGFVAKADRLAPNGSTQNNESFNHMCVTKAPKSRFYAGSNALPFRVAAAVLQKNVGATHISDVYRQAGLSPGKRTLHNRERMETRRKRRAERQRTEGCKKRRLFNKFKQGTNESKKNKGVSYESNMSDLMENPVLRNFQTQSTNSTQEDWIPVGNGKEKKFAVVIVDTETTDLAASRQIIQLGAISGSKLFEVCMIPTKKINIHSSEVNKFKMVQGKLEHHGQPVMTCPSIDAGNAFIEFLSTFGCQIIIAGNNFIKFDGPIIVNWLQKLGLLEKFCDLVYGFTETMPLIGDDDTSALGKLSWRYLTEPQWISLLNNAHDAVADCKLLKGLLDFRKVSDKQIQDAAIGMRKVCQNLIVERKWRAQRDLLQPLESTVSKGMLTKMAKAGVTISDLKDAFQRHGKKGVHAYLAALDATEKPRVTKMTKITYAVADLIETLL